MLTIGGDRQTGKINVCNAINHHNYITNNAIYITNNESNHIHSAFPICSAVMNTLITSIKARCATSKYFQIIGSSNDIESYFGLDNTSSLNVQIFFCHWGHLAIIHLWLSANLFQLGWNANYELYTLNPIPTIPIAHGIWDAHIPLSYDYTIVLSYSAIYNVVCTVGFTNVFQIYNFVIICVPLGKLHLISLSELLQWLPLNKSYLFITTTTSLSIIIVQNNIRFNFHTGIQIGLFSIAWCGHLLHVAIPISSIMNLSHISEIVCLTCNGGLNWIWTHSLYLTDIAHHHLASGILFVWASHVYLSLFKAFGYRTRSVLYIGIHVSSSLISRPLGKSLHLKLAQHCTTCGLITAAINQHIYSLTPYLYLSYDYIRTVALYVHHSWIAEFLMIATFAHKAIFLIRDYTFHISLAWLSHIRCVYS